MHPKLAQSWSKVGPKSAQILDVGGPDLIFFKSGGLRNLSGDLGIRLGQGQ